MIDPETAHASAAEPHARPLASRLAALRPGGLLTVVGLDRSDVKEMLANEASSPLVMRIDIGGAATPAGAIGRILDDLAALAAGCWPRWCEETIVPAPPLLRSSWRRGAVRFASAGRQPRFRWLPRETEFGHLLSIHDTLVLLAEVDPVRPQRAALDIATLEWCCRHGAAVVALLAGAPAPEPPWDRLLSGAFTFERPPASRLADRVFPRAALNTPGSAVERRMRDALRAAPDLAGLFEDEVTLSLGRLGPTPRVDLLWREGRVVVELDGPEHERDRNYGADRHRDYELLVAGYLVLRLTNAEVQLDLGRSLDKIRRVVGLRKTHG